jgi:hypothetical protein
VVTMFWHDDATFLRKSCRTASRQAHNTRHEARHSPCDTRRDQHRGPKNSTCTLALLQVGSSCDYQIDSWIVPRNHDRQDPKREIRDGRRDSIKPPHDHPTQALPARYWRKRQSLGRSTCQLKAKGGAGELSTKAYLHSQAVAIVRVLCLRAHGWDL